MPDHSRRNAHVHSKASNPSTRNTWCRSFALANSNHECWTKGYGQKCMGSCRFRISNRRYRKRDGTTLWELPDIVFIDFSGLDREEFANEVWVRLQRHGRRDSHGLGGTVAQNTISLVWSSYFTQRRQCKRHISNVYT